MDGETLQMPFDRRVLDEIARAAQAENKLDVTSTVRWILSHPSVEAMTDGIRRAWDASSLVLSEWTGRIEEVQVWAWECDLALRVRLGGSGPSFVYQGAPLSENELEEMVAGYAVPIPGVVRDLALAAPGLSIDGYSKLAHASYVRWPLAVLQSWLDSSHAYGGGDEGEGASGVDLSPFLMELAQTQL